MKKKLCFETAPQERVIEGCPLGLHFETAPQERVIEGCPLGIKSKKSGESLPEVMISAVLFLLIVAIMQGTISFCTNAFSKSREIRETNARICRNLQKTDFTGGDKESLSFHAVSPDGSQQGTDILFSLQIEKGKKEVLDQDASGNDRKIVFYVYGSASENAGGGQD